MTNYQELKVQLREESMAALAAAHGAFRDIAAAAREANDAAENLAESLGRLQGILGARREPWYQRLGRWLTGR
jgi:hypothetical protein